MSGLRSTLNSKRAKQHVRGWPNDPVARVIVPIIEGQVRSFINDHPEMIARPKDTAWEQVILSLTKRISNDLLCGGTTARLASALGTLLERDEAAARGSQAASLAGEAGVRLASPANADADEAA